MNTHTHTTAPTRFVDANSIRYAYRRFGEKVGIPLLFLQHFRAPNTIAAMGAHVVIFVEEAKRGSS